MPRLVLPFLNMPTKFCGNVLRKVCISMRPSWRPSMKSSNLRLSGAFAPMSETYWSIAL